MRIFSAFVMSILMATPAVSQSINGAEARAQLFSTKSESIQLSDALSKQDRATITALIPLMEKQMRTPVKYYSAIAYAPDEGLVSDSLQGAFNFHTTRAADAAALAACNKVKKSSSSDCRLAARVLPKGYKARELTLSYDATEGFNRVYRKQRGAKSFAISTTSGAWGLGATDAEAIASCNQDAGRATDCSVVIKD